MQGVTAEQCTDFIAQLTADALFFKGLGKTYTFLKEIDVLEKLSEAAAIVSRIFKEGFDTHLANNPIMVTAEGITIKLSDAMHNISDVGGGKNIINSSKALLESVYAKATIDLENDIQKIKTVHEGKVFGFGELALKPIKIDLEHILGMELSFNQRGTLKISGFHHDFMNAFEKNGILKFGNKINHNNGCYTADILYEGFIAKKDATFFPTHWSREEVVNKIYEACDDFKKSGIAPTLNNKMKYKISGFTSEGIEIEMYITKNGQITTAYPIF